MSPSEESFKAAAAGADWNSVPGMGVILTDQPGKASWPLTSASFILIHKVQEHPDVAKEVLKFFDWSFKNGNGMASELDYVGMPDPVVDRIKSVWKAQIKDASGKPVY